MANIRLIRYSNNDTHYFDTYLTETNAISTWTYLQKYEWVAVWLTDHIENYIGNKCTFVCFNIILGNIIDTLIFYLFLGRLIACM